MLVMFVGFSVSRIHISGKDLGVATLVFSELLMSCFQAQKVFMVMMIVRVKDKGCGYHDDCNHLNIQQKLVNKC